MKKNKKIKTIFKMKTLIPAIIIFLLLFSCDKKKETIDNSKQTIDIESEYVKDTLYKKGDARRYGVYPNKPVNGKYLNAIIALADKGEQITFPKGHYNIRFYLKGVTDAKFIFEDAIFGALYVIEKDSITSNKIELKGKITVLDKLFIRKSSNINFEEVLVKTDTSKSIKHKKNRGVSIYIGAKNIHFNYLEIKNTGGGNNPYFKEVAAALQVHGWNNNPENVTIDELKISDVARSAVYLTGNNHNIKKATITNYGFGSNKGLAGLGDADKKDVNKFTGFWINKCNFSNIDSLVINTQPNKGKYSLHLGLGISANPTFISNIHFNSNAKKLPIKTDKFTNVLVENEY